jgi:hypothetical protein
MLDYRMTRLIFTIAAWLDWLLDSPLAHKHGEVCEICNVNVDSRLRVDGYTLGAYDAITLVRQCDQCQEDRLDDV